MSVDGDFVFFGGLVDGGVGVWVNPRLVEAVECHDTGPEVHLCSGRVLYLSRLHWDSAEDVLDVIGFSQKLGALDHRGED